MPRDKQPFDFDSIAREVAAAFAQDVAPYKNDRIINIAASSSGDADLREALVSFWLAVGEVTDALANDAWDVVVCDVRTSDDGMVLGFASKLHTPFVMPQRPDERETSHVVPVPGAQVHALIPTPNPLDEQELDFDDPSHYDQLEVVLAQDFAMRTQLVKHALEDGRLAERKQHWLARPGFAVLQQVVGDVPYESKFKLLLGRPPPEPPQPETALGVFARLFQATDNAISRSNTCFTFEGDELVEVVLSGADVNDERLELLDWAKNLDSVCQNLRRITLHSTRVSKRGVTKLEELFPNRGRLTRRVVVS